MGILSELWPDDAIFKHRGQNHLEQAAIEPLGAASHAPASPPCGALAEGREEFHRRTGQAYHSGGWAAWAAPRSLSRPPGAHRGR